MMLRNAFRAGLHYKKLTAAQSALINPIATTTIAAAKNGGEASLANLNLIQRYNSTLNQS